MSLKTLATMSAVILLASASLASAQVRTHAGQAQLRPDPYANSYFNQDYWKAMAPFMVPSDPDPTKGTIFDTR
jgi:hypothetical protein